MNVRMPLTSLGAWIFSMLVHASGFCVAILLAAEFSVVPRVAPFRWDITLVAASRQEAFSSEQPTPTLASSARMATATDDVPSQTTQSSVYQMSGSPRTIIEHSAPAADGHMPPGTSYSTKAGTPSDSTNAPKPSTEPALQDRSAESPTLAKMAWPVTSSTPPAEMPPPAVEAPDQSTFTMEPSVQEAPRLVSLPAPQFRPTPVSLHAQPDYGWLASAVATEVEHVKRYPAHAKWHRWQGNVVVQAVIHEDGRISDIQVMASSGHDTLDDDAIALLERISPLQLQYPLDQSSIVVRIPIGYRLE